MNKLSKNSLTPTMCLLVMEFGPRTFIDIEEIAESHLGMSIRTAQRKAHNCELPFPVFKSGEGRKSPWVVSIQHLAEYIEEKAAAAHKEWKHRQVA